MWRENRHTNTEIDEKQSIKNINSLEEEETEKITHSKWRDRERERVRGRKGGR